MDAVPPSMSACALCRWPKSSVTSRRERALRLCGLSSVRVVTPRWVATRTSPSLTPVRLGRMPSPPPDGEPVNSQDMIYDLNEGRGSATGARNHTQCDSLLIGGDCGAHTFPYVEMRNDTAEVEHEASTTRVNEDQLFYCRQRGISAEDAVALVVNGFCREVLQQLPMEFAVEAQKLVGISLEGSVG